MSKRRKSIDFYSWLPYGALICVLVVIYISNVHRVQKKIRVINAEHKEIEELKREYFSIKKRSMYNGTLNQVVKEIDGIDLDKRVSMPKKIEKSNV